MNTTLAQIVSNLQANLLVTPSDHIDETLMHALCCITDKVTNNGNDVDSGNFFTEQTYWNELKMWTKEAGFEFLGNGFFSGAYKHPQSDKAFKLGIKKDDSAAAYTAFCRLHQGKAGIPTVHNVMRSNGCYAVVMDLYNKFVIDDQFNAGCHEIAQAIIHTKKWADGDYNRSEHMSERFASLNDKWLTEFEETCINIREFFNGLASFDLHEGNVMIDRKTGMMVITDPVSYTRVVSWEVLENTQVLLDSKDKAIHNKFMQKRKAHELRKAHKKDRQRRNRKMAKADADLAERRRLDGHLWNARRNLKGLGERWTDVFLMAAECVQPKIDRKINDIQDALIRGLNLPVDNRLNAEFLRG